MQTDDEANPADPGWAVDDDELARIDRDLDAAIDKVAQARAVLGRAERMAERPGTFLELLAGVHRLLREARSAARPAESCLAERGEPLLALEAEGLDRLAEKLECVYRPNAQACRYRVTVLEPAPVNLEALRRRLQPEPAVSAEACGGPADPVARLRRDQRAARRQAGFAADRPGLAPAVDAIDPRHYLRRQLAETRAQIAAGRPGRVQFRCTDCGMGPVFLHLQPLGDGALRLSFSHDNATWAPVQRAPLPPDRLDPVALLEPFVPRCRDPEALTARGYRPAAPELAAIASAGTG
jgi:hypothetical protein